MPRPSHTGWRLDPVKQVSVYDEMPASCLPIHITEVGAGGGNRYGKSPEEAEKVLGDYVVNAMTCAFGHQAVEAFFFGAWAVCAGANARRTKRCRSTTACSTCCGSSG
jgi:hypothetical protein